MKRFLLGILAKRTVPQAAIAVILAVLSYGLVLKNAVDGVLDVGLVRDQSWPAWLLAYRWLWLVVATTTVAAVSAWLYMFNRTLPEWTVRLLRDDKDVVFFLAAYIRERALHVGQRYLGARFGQDMKHVYGIAQDRLRLVDTRSLDKLLPFNSHRLLRAASDINEQPGDIVAAGKKIDIVEPRYAGEIDFLLEVAREPSFGKAAIMLADRVRYLAEDAGGRMARERHEAIGSFANSFGLLERKSELRMGYPPMNLVKREIVEFMTQALEGGRISQLSPKDDWEHFENDLAEDNKLCRIVLDHGQGHSSRNILHLVRDATVSFLNANQCAKKGLLDVASKSLSNCFDPRTEIVVAYGYSSSVVSILGTLRFPSPKQETEICIVRTQQKATIADEEEQMCRELEDLGLRPPGLYDFEELVSMQLRDVVVMLGFEFMNQQGCSLQHYGAGQRIGNLIAAFARGRHKTKVVLMGESYKIWDFNRVDRGVPNSSLLDINACVENYLLTDAGLHRYDTANKRWQHANTQGASNVPCCQESWEALRKAQVGDWRAGSLALSSL